jgi:glycosyltransferase involved in cell wall biosynthesis
VNVLLYRRRLDLASGAGQLLLAQARALETAGATVELACRGGRAKFFLRSGRWPKRWTRARQRARQADSGWRIVDHSLEIPSAQIVFVHNLQSELKRYLQRPGLDALAAQEAAFFRELRLGTPIVANSRLVKAGLIREFGLGAQRIEVIHPGFEPSKFNAARAVELRALARRMLGIGEHTPLVGLVTSGDLQKRGLDAFLVTASAVARAAPDVRFLVVGSSSLPEAAKRHPLVAAGTVRYQPKSTRPELWFAALDVFLYPALFEEFGMVVLEAQACGIPILTSRRVGAAECLAHEYEPWLLEQPNAGDFARLALELLADGAARQRLAAAGAERAAALGLQKYADASAALILTLKTGESSTG